ncbi:hypothetical protein GCM10010449_81810 [Streptomyces rectiviolaceus]|uniref:Uncharacterized protein n=1 Tax=Streptomyces rectiviolaceus TaxID=332591 RepID=A0ABP6NK95_9ACTN
MLVAHVVFMESVLPEPVGSGLAFHFFLGLPLHAFPIPSWMDGGTTSTCWRARGFTRVDSALGQVDGVVEGLGPGVARRGRL